MAITKDTVDYIAKLARLKLTEDESIKMESELNSILGYVEKLNEVNIENVEPLSHVIDLSNVFRSDEVKQSIEPEEILKNAPAKTEKFFRVPKVIG